MGQLTDRVIELQSRLDSLEQQQGVLLAPQAANDDGTVGTTFDYTPIIPDADVLPVYITNGDGDTAQTHSKHHSIIHNDCGFIQIYGFKDAGDTMAICKHKDCVVYQKLGVVATTCDSRKDTAGTKWSGINWGTHRHHVSYADSCKKAIHSSSADSAKYSGHAHYADNFSAPAWDLLNMWAVVLHVAYADNAGYADYALNAYHSTKSDTAGYAHMAYAITDTGFHKHPHSRLSSFKSDDHTDTNFTYLLATGDASRNKMAGYIGDTGKRSSIAPSARELHEMSGDAVLNWQTRTLAKLWHCSDTLQVCQRVTTGSRFRAQGSDGSDVPGLFTGGILTGNVSIKRSGDLTENDLVLVVS